MLLTGVHKLYNMYHIGNNNSNNNFSLHSFRRIQIREEWKRQSVAHHCDVVIVSPHSQNGSFRPDLVRFVLCGNHRDNIIYYYCYYYYTRVIIINTNYPFARDDACIADKRTTKGRYSTRMGLNNILETRTGRRRRSGLTPRTEGGA